MIKAASFFTIADMVLPVSYLPQGLGGLWRSFRVKPASAGMAYQTVKIIASLQATWPGAASAAQQADCAPPFSQLAQRQKQAARRPNITRLLLNIIAHVDDISTLQDHTQKTTSRVTKMALRPARASRGVLPHQQAALPIKRIS
jgi:hypothetical protein